MQLDLTPDELVEWQGRNPRPADFDEFWRDSLAEMEAVEPCAERGAAAFNISFADCFSLRFTGVRGARLHAKCVIPKKRAGKVPAVLFFHGYSMSSGDWSHYLNYAACGIACAALDCRGQGGESEDTGGVKGGTLSGQFVRGLDDEPRNLLMRHIFLDTAQLAKIVSGFPEVDGSRLASVGASQGGALSLACAALYPGIKRAVSVYPFLSDYKRVWELDLAKDAYAELRDYFRRFDPRHERETEVFTKLGYIDIQHLAPRIKAEVWLFTGLMDTICPPSSQFAAYNKIKSQKRVTFYPDFGHEDLPGKDDIVFQYLAKEL